VKEIQDLKRLIKGEKKVVPLSIPVLTREQPISEIYEPETVDKVPVDLLQFEPVFRR
jgi:hypothetical protein